MPCSMSRNSASPSITNSSAGCSMAGVSCATWESTHRGGMETSPASAWSSPRTSANRLDLPAPFGPTRPTFCPGWTFIDASSRRTRAARRRVMLEMRSTDWTPTYAGAGHGDCLDPDFIVVIDGYRRVIGKPRVVEDLRLSRLLRDPRRGDLVVDPPAEVLLARLAEGEPPSEAVGRGIDRAEHVHEAVLLEDAREPVPLGLQEAGRRHVLLPVLHVDFPVGDVPVAADHELAAALSHGGELGQEALHEIVLAHLRLGALHAGW